MGQTIKPTVMQFGQPKRVISVLVVSGNARERTSLAGIFEGATYAVSQADNGLDALERVRTESFDLVVTSILMPDMDGIELLRAIRAKGGTPPVVAITASREGMNNIYSTCAKALGAADTHAMPLDAQTFLAAVGTVVRRHQMRIAAALSPEHCPEPSTWYV